MSFSKEQIEVVTAMRNKPSLYAQHRLKLKLHPIQGAVLDSLFSKPKTKVSLRACNESGKTSYCIAPAILYAMEMQNATVVSTSATFRQITKQLIPYLKQHSGNYPKWEFLDNSIKINGETKYIGFSTSEDSKFQGFHENPNNPLLIIVDEAAGVKDDIFQSIGRCNPTWLLIAGSPLGPEGVFYSIEHNEEMHKQFIHYKIQKSDILKENGWWIERKDMEDFVKMWGVDHPLVLSSVYAEFASNIENGLISLNELDRCYEFPPKQMGTDKHVGIDVAAGGDSNVIALRIGNKIEIIDEWKEREVMRACDKIANHLNKLKESHGIIPSYVSLDSDGMGIGFISRLKDLGWNINEYHGGRTPDNPQYASSIAEAWLDGVKKIKNCAVILPNDNELKMQILSRKQIFNDKGKLKLESKDDMRSRGIKSPDKADAIFISMLIPNSTAAKFTNVPRPPARTYAGYF